MSQTHETSRDSVVSKHLPQVVRSIREVGYRYRWDPSRQDDFRSFVFEKLTERDFARLRTFRGDSSFRTFITQVVSRLAVDFQRRHLGRWRPSARARKIGELAMRIERLWHRDGFSWQEAKRIAKAYHSGVESAEISRIAARIPTRRPRVALCDKSVSELLAGGRLADQELLRKEDQKVARATGNALAEAYRALTPEERSVLALRFRDRLPAGQIGSRLGISARRVYTLTERALRRMRRSLEADGVDALAVRGLLAQSTASESLGLEVSRLSETIERSNGRPRSGGHLE